MATERPSLWLAAAALLQAKSVLDNADGGLARATGRVTELGRYLDTVCDLVVNAAVFAALALHGPPLGAVAAFAVVTLALTADFNAEKRYKEEHGLPAGAAHAPPGAPPRLLALFRGAYRLVLAPQDRAYRALDELLFRAAAGRPWEGAAAAERRRWADLLSTGALVNLGLSTQYLALGVALALGMPYAYVVICWWQLPYLLAVQALRVLRYRAPEAAG